MSESDFPSGPWVGFYTYSAAHDKHRMDLGLDFANGRVSGEGNDDVGAFVISGRFDSAKGECDWTKTYIGAHDVFYRGLAWLCQKTTLEKRGRMIGMKTFGASAPLKELQRKFGFIPDSIVTAAKEQLAQGR